MTKRNKVKSGTKVLANRRSKKYVKSDSLSSSASHINSCIERSKCRVSSGVSATKFKSRATAKQPENIATTSGHAAAHFGYFYGFRDDNVRKTHRDNRWRDCIGAEGAAAAATAATEGRRRSEFTRQMVHKLERASDTEDYARQVSTLLKETVEPANFRLNPFLSENSIPNGSRGISDYPLWYKEPHEMPLVFSNPIAQPDA